MKILAIERELAGGSRERFDTFKAAEARGVWELYQSGVIREIYFHVERDIAVLVLECPDAASAQEQLNRLPLVSHGLIAFDLIPLRPYPGFARLFQDSKESSQ